MGQEDVAGCRRYLRLSPAQPGPMRHCERARRHRADAQSRRLGATEGVNQRLSVGGATGVVPQRRLAQRVTGVVEHDQAMLLGTDGQRPDVGGKTGLAQGVRQGGLPISGVALPGATFTLYFMGRAP